MTTAARPGATVILAALDLAVRAPSLHNTQPWCWRVGENVARL
jgi:nitroreductase